MVGLTYGGSLTFWDFVMRVISFLSKSLAFLFQIFGHYSLQNLRIFFPFTCDKLRQTLQSTHFLGLLQFSLESNSFQIVFKSFKLPCYGINHNSPVNVYFLLLILEMEYPQKFQTNHEDGNKLTTHGRKRSPEEGIYLGPDEVK